MGESKKNTNIFIENGDELIIKTKSGSKIIADLEDYKKLSKYSWCISKTGYAVCNTGKKVVRMHRYILDAEPGKVIDHINHNKLDNRKKNLRICSQQENLRNVKPCKTSQTGEVGIRITKGGKFNARITHNKKEIHIGNFETLSEAVAARIEAEKKFHGIYGAHVSEVTIREV